MAELEGACGVPWLMPEWQFWALPALVMAASALLTGWIRGLAMARGLVDEPNARSSHHLPTPRGGGLAIVAVVLASLVALAVVGVLPMRELWGLAGAGLLVGGIGWVDDHRHVPAPLRLLVHFAGAAWALAWLGGLPPVELFGAAVDLRWPGQALALVYIVWMLNLYNFMDGIDGIAGVEAVTVCLGAVVLHRLVDPSSEGSATSLLVAGAVCGFLVWNFPRARIFMGDVGSGFLGILLALMSLEAGRVAPELFWGWLVLLGAFVVDATTTLMRRLLRFEAVHEAHRSHAYQRLAHRIGSHPPVTLSVGAINVLWLLPMAILVATRRVDGVLGLGVAYAPLIGVALALGAGRPNESRGSD